jgi:hypothetical protein
VRHDDDWWILLLLLARIPNLDAEEEELHLRPLIREILATMLATFPDLANPDVLDPIIVNDCGAVNRIEKKFWSLVENVIKQLREKQLDTNTDAVMKEARSILKKCFVWQGITAKEHRIIKEGAKIWRKVLAREEFIISIGSRLF